MLGFQGVAVFYYNKLDERHRSLQWLLERARIEFTKENSFDQTKWESVSLKTHSLKNQGCKTLLSMKHHLPNTTTTICTSTYTYKCLENNSTSPTLSNIKYTTFSKSKKIGRRESTKRLLS